MSEIDVLPLESLNDYFLGSISGVLFLNRDVVNFNLQKDENKEIIRKFASNTSVKSIIAEKSQSDQEGKSIKLQIDFSDLEKGTHILIFIKTQAFQVSESNSVHEYAQTIQLMNFGPITEEENIIGLNSNFLRYFSQPLFLQMKKDFDKKPDPEKQSFNNLQKKMQEFILEANNFTNSTELPEIRFEFNPQVVQLVKAFQYPQVEQYANHYQELIKEKSFADNISDLVGCWTLQIKQVLESEKKELSCLSFAKECQYWISFEKALSSIEKERKTLEAQIMIELTRNKNPGKSFLMQYLPVEQLNKKSKDYNAFLKEFPFQNYKLINRIEDLGTAIQDVFKYIQFSKNEYTKDRISLLMKIIHHEFSESLVYILKPLKIMSLDYKAFTEVHQESVFQKYEKCYSEYFKQKKSWLSFPETQFQVLAIKKRLEMIQDVLHYHYKLKGILQYIIQIQEKQNVNVKFLKIQEIDEAFQHFQMIDYLRIDQEGEDIFKTITDQYYHKIDSVEKSIGQNLRAQLANTKKSKDMLCILSNYSQLLDRDNLKSALRDYQNQLMKSIFDDQEEIKQLIVQGYQVQQNHNLSQLRDIPFYSGQYIWSQQVLKKIEKNKANIEKIMGPDWVNTSDGQKYIQLVTNFKEKLSNEKQQEQIRQRISAQFQGNYSDQKVIKVTGRDRQLQTQANFDETMISNLKELKILKKLKIQVPYSATLQMHEQIIYNVIKIKDICQFYNNLMQNLDPQILKYLSSIRQLFQKDMRILAGLQWKSTNLQNTIISTANKLTQFEYMTNYLKEKFEYISSALTNIKTASLQHESLLTALNNIQNIIYDLDFFSQSILVDASQGELDKKKNTKSSTTIKASITYSNLDILVSETNQKIELILTERLKEMINLFINELENFSTLQTTVFIQKDSSHELKVKDNIIVLEPSLHKARYVWYFEFQKATSMLTNLPLIILQKSSSFVAQPVQTQIVPTFAPLLALSCQKEFIFAYERIDTIISRAEEYVAIWLNYQTLWDIDINMVCKEYLKNDNQVWQQVLTEIKVGRQTFDVSETEKYFGPILINFKLVQNKINSKYDQWHLSLLERFGKNFQQELKDFCYNLECCKKRLEVIDFKSNQQDVINYVMELKKQKENHKSGEEQWKLFISCNKILKQQKYVPPPDWKQIEQCEYDWNQYNQLLNRKQICLKNELKSLQQKLYVQNNDIQEKINLVKDNWKKQAPPKGSDAKEFVEYYTKLSAEVEILNANYQKCWKASELLSQEVGDEKERDQEVGDSKFGGQELGDPDQLKDLSEEISNYKDSWGRMQEVWQNIDDLKDQNLKDIKNQKIQQVFDLCNQKLKDQPQGIQQHDSFEQTRERLSSYHKTNKLIFQLKSESMKNRHWKQVLTQLKLSKIPLSDITVGHLWQSNLLQKEQVLEEIMTVARGEFVLEQMLKTIKDYWHSLEIELFKQQNKNLKLIKGWDDLFSKLDEDLNNLSSMKISPYYKTAQEEIQAWDEKLQKYRIILDVWIEVQRRWVYLEGIFLGSSDIKTQLPNEYRRFAGINSDFENLMKKVAAKPLVLEVMSIPGLLKILERLSDLLAKIQKALGDYLEKQRQSFARFYFVGDEDLLEIIGNSKDVGNIQRHLSKMYAGIISLEYQKEDIQAMASREGELVQFKGCVKVDETKTIHQWLGQIDEQMRSSLAFQLQESFKRISCLKKGENQELDDKLIFEIVEQYCAQVVLLCLQIFWCFNIESGFEAGSIQFVEQYVNKFLTVLADKVINKLPKQLRNKLEQIITDFVHQRDITRDLIQKQTSSKKDFSWQYYMRFYWNETETDELKRLMIKMASSSLSYGFEYLGIQEKLVQTPLTDRCYLTLTQAMHLRMGGCPFGPAGTGKTESVKALGSQLGRFVLVFNCDETFDFHAMGRIFIGLCQVGAWGCFDEFNRLEERMLSAVSQQILIIQTGLRERLPKIDLMNRDVKLNPQMGVFVTMNPGYAGRSNLPENLKQLFRQMAMVKPDRDLIAQVMLYSQGFSTAERLSGKIVSLFELCNDQLSSQPHYDFGLRALKSVLVSAGNLKRQEIKEEGVEHAEYEEKILIRSVCETMVPKLIAEDIPLLSNLLSGVFPGSTIPAITEIKLSEQLNKVCFHKFYKPNENFIQKVLQLYQIQKLHHGVMMVGPTGCGKSAAWKVLIEALQRVDNIKGEAYIIDPKAINKDELYGRLDNATLEWTDGVFTSVLRKITENIRGESAKRHWIIFDGDVDPEWAENLNSVLDDNKLLTLPNGERISIPPNVRIMFEVETLRYATLATVSRCGMVWFNEEVISLEMVFYNYIQRVVQNDFDEEPVIDFEDSNKAKQNNSPQQENPEVTLRKVCISYVENYFYSKPSTIEQIMEKAFAYNHVMEFTSIRAIESTFTILRKGVQNVVEYQENNRENPLSPELLEQYMQKWTLFSVIWGVSGSMKLSDRNQFSLECAYLFKIDLPHSLSINNTSSLRESLIDYEVNLKNGQWVQWKNKVPQIDIDPMRVTEADLIITTIDILRHQEVLGAWLAEHRPFLLCGPPGSGKTMTLMQTLKSYTDFEMIFVNFSSGTTPSLILKQFDHYCEYLKTTSGITLRPKQINKWLIVFCDEINLPDQDKYGTMTVITFLRTLYEQNGFWRPWDKVWISIERIQFVGACNPPTDSGRKPLSSRFLRHTPLLLVDFPGQESLKQIYGTFNKAMLKRVPALRSKAEDLTNAMVELYVRSQEHFIPEMQPHYIYSPRELTRWKYAIYEALNSVETLDQLARLWAHEAYRLFYDRLVETEEKVWCENLIQSIGQEHFRGISLEALQLPILFSNYHNKLYVSVKKEEIRDIITARLKTFYEESLNVPIVVFDAVIDHILRIDRVLRQPLGHLLLVGASGVGKTTLTRFVAWMNNLQVFQIKAGRKYNILDFDNDLREVMRKAGVTQEKVCFIFDESNVLSPAFLEKMNALLASGEIPGLYEGEEFTKLINQCRDAFQKENKRMDYEDQLYKTFIRNVQRNLHVVFTMNPANPDFSNRTASSPALFNRCVIDWFGYWSLEGLQQVAREFTKYVDANEGNFVLARVADSVDLRRESLVESIVQMHKIVVNLNYGLQKEAKRFNHITPRDFLDFIKHFVELFKEKKENLEDQQLHLNKGLDKLIETEKRVAEMQHELASKRKELEEKQRVAHDKLDSLVEENNELNKKKASQVELLQQIQIEEKEIEINKSNCEEKLKTAIPALEKAKQALTNIAKDELDQVKSYNKPPPLVQLTLEAVVSILLSKYQEKWEWALVKQEVRKPTFIKSVQEFNTDSIPETIRKKIWERYINNPDWDPQKISYSSKAAGPLAEWVKSQLSYAEIMKQTEPLNKSIQEATVRKQVLVQKRELLEKEIDFATKRLEQLKQEHEQSIKLSQKIEQEMQVVKTKVDRSTSLLGNLSQERYRWGESSKNFQFQMNTLLGDCLLAGAFSSYIGFFDHYYRKILTDQWQHLLENLIKIKFRPEMQMIEFLSTPSELLKWQVNGLPNDDLCKENGILMKRFHRYPLIIDPAGQTLEFILKNYQQKNQQQANIVRSSFNDDSFMKNLETCLRFGAPLLVEDVESVDPILNSVLNREIHHTGGRVLIRVGDQDIDFSPNFVLFMITRDSDTKFSPDLCSRVTFVNFTVTPSSLQNQCLNLFLRNEAPDIEEKRIKLMKLQGEYSVRLRELEDQLLNSLSKVSGSILDSDEVITNLEGLKNEAQQVQKEMNESIMTMDEVEKVKKDYLQLATTCSLIYFSLVSLSQVHYLYQFSLNFFLDTFIDLLKNSIHLKNIPQKELAKRRNIILDQIFLRVYSRVRNSLLDQDKNLFLLKLCQIKLGKEYDQQFTPIFKVLLAENQQNCDFQSLFDNRFNQKELLYLNYICGLPQLKSLYQHMEQETSQWTQFLESNQPENNFPDFISVNSQITPKNLLIKLILIKALRPDRFTLISRALIEFVIGKDAVSEDVINLNFVVEQETTSKTPILLCSAPGFDPSYKIEYLSKELNVKLVSVAIGSAEGYGQASDAINKAQKMGNWVMLKNVHLSPTWLSELEKSIHKLTPHPNFRLFLTKEFNPKVPTTLIRQSFKIVFEPPSGIKASLQRIYSSVLTKPRTEKEPRERSKLHFLVAWLHSILLERLRFTPLGYTKVYEFNEADQRCALDLIDEYIDSYGNKSNINPKDLPWEAIKTILTQNLYGGKIDNDYDLKVLKSLVDHLFSVKSFDTDHQLFISSASNSSSILVPQIFQHQQYQAWINELPSNETPEWAGLPNHVEKLLKVEQTDEILRKLLQIQDISSEDETINEQKENKDQNNKVQWLSEVLRKANKFLSLIEINLLQPARDSNSLTNPLFRFLEREVIVIRKLAKQVISDLKDVKLLCEGLAAAGNLNKMIAKDIYSDTIPTQWRKYQIHPKLSLTEWIQDLRKRLDQYNRLISLPNFQQKGVWLGGLLFPEAFLTASRQFVAQKNKGALDELELQARLISDIEDETCDDNSFLCNNMLLEGGIWGELDNRLTLNIESTGINKKLKPIVFTWTKIENELKTQRVLVPIYLNNFRKNLIYSIKVTEYSLRY